MRLLITLSLSLLLTLGTLLFVGCGSTSLELKNSPMVPAARGEVKLSTDDNNNSVIELEVKHLAPPASLTPPRSVYVVWVESPEGRQMNLGQLVVTDDLEGSFSGTTALRRFRIFVTAEEIPTATTPGSEVVLSTDLVNP